MAMLTNVLGAIVLVVSGLGAYYANGLKGALEGSDLAKVWQHMGLGVILLFIGAIAGGVINSMGEPGENVEMALDVTLLFVALASGGFLNGLRLQLEKVK